jgi:hypothetical protein
MHLLRIDLNNESNRTDLEQKAQIVKQCFINCGANVDHCFDPATYIPQVEPIEVTPSKNPENEVVRTRRRFFCQIL